MRDGAEIDDLLDRLRGFAKYEHDDASVGDEAARMIDEMRRDINYALLSWDGTRINKSHDGRLQECMEYLRNYIDGKQYKDDGEL